ncbi:alpha/beta hydrolase family protein [Micropruina sp.]|uniref:alpha/beta hydrolase family protein n=1 Tax=Micropruina sp. TaxID=2737536 RepID=UPI0039E547F1
MIVAVASTLQDHAPLLVVEDSGTLTLASAKPANFASGQLEAGPIITGSYFADPYSMRVAMIRNGVWHWFDIPSGAVARIDHVPPMAHIVAIDDRGAIYWTVQKGQQHWLFRSCVSETTPLIWVPLPITSVLVNSIGMIGVVTNQPSPPFDKCTIIVEPSGKFVRVCQVDGIAWSGSHRLWGAVRGPLHLQATEFNSDTGASKDIHPSRKELATDVFYRNGAPDLFIVEGFTTLPVRKRLVEVHHHWRGPRCRMIVSSLCGEIRLTENSDDVVEKSLTRQWRMADDEGFIHGLEVGSGASLVIYLPGGPGDPLFDRYNMIVASLVRSGRTVWLPSLSGYGGQSTQHRNSIYGNWGNRERLQLESVLTIATLEGYGPVSVVGHSYGAYLALQMSDPRVRAVVAWSPFVDPESLWQEVPSSRILLHQWGLGHPDGRRRSLGCHDQPGCGYVPPTLFLTGTRDAETPMTAALRIEIGRRRLAPGTTHVALPIGHTAFHPSDANMVSNEIVSFLDEIE